jgi:phospholipid/cholesterol/gamma-HCH transport system substrate-binding protein
MKRDTVNYLVVGIFVMGMFVLLMLALLRMTGRDTGTTHYYVQYTKIPGIIVGSTVTYDGFQVGRVNGISPVRKNGSMHYRLELAIRDDWKIPVDSRAIIVMPALLSDRQIDIRAGASQDFLKDGALIASSQEPDFMQAMKAVATEINDLSENTIKPLIGSIQGPLKNVGDALDSNVPHIAENLNILLEKLNNTAAQLNEIMSDKNREHISRVFHNADSITSGLAGFTKDFAEIKEKLNQLFGASHEILEENSIDVRKSVSELRVSSELVAQHLNTILYHLEGTSRNMHELSRSLKENPSLLLRGATVKEEKK